MVFEPAPYLNPFCFMSYLFFPPQPRTLTLVTPPVPICPQPSLFLLLLEPPQYDRHEPEGTRKIIVSDDPLLFSNPPPSSKVAYLTQFPCRNGLLLPSPEIVATEYRLVVSLPFGRMQPPQDKPQMFHTNLV